MNYYGMLILRERLSKGWSQAGLCKGICAVSYLSKIETGKAVPSKEVRSLLLERLDLHTDPAVEAAASRCAEEAYELLFSGQNGDLKAVIPEDFEERFRATAAKMDLLLIRRYTTGEKALETAWEVCMDERQLALQRTLQGRLEEALALLPNAFFHWELGAQYYEDGHYTDAIEHLQAGYDLAARDGAAQLMLMCRAFIGNCYCNTHDMERMLSHYAAASRLAVSLGNTEMLETIRYNTAAAQMEHGEFEEAYQYYSVLTTPNVMSLHKLSICCEKTGRKNEALIALKKAFAATKDHHDPETVSLMLQVVRFRLEHPDYLRCQEYGTLLLECFERCRNEFPQGYASFHLPWVIEWYTSARQYKKVCELMSEFPESYR